MCWDVQRQGCKEMGMSEGKVDNTLFSLPSLLHMGANSGTGTMGLDNYI